MSDVGIRTAYEEIPVFFDAEGASIFGIVTRPRGRVGDTAVIVLPGGGTPLTTNRNRVTVRLCRALASLGFVSLRMDYHGTGESAGTVDEFHLGRPFVEDVRAAVEHLRRIGVERIVLLGSTCFGSRTALATAEELDAVEEVVALATPLRDFGMGERHAMNAAARRSLGRYLIEAMRPRTLRGLFDRRSRRAYVKHARAKLRVIVGRFSHLVPRSKPQRVRSAVSPHFLRPLERLVQRRVPVLFVYGSDEDYYQEWLVASSNELAGILERAGSLIQVVTVPGRIHGLPRVTVQDAVVELILDWARARKAALAIPGSGRVADEDA